MNRPTAAQRLVFSPPRSVTGADLAVLPSRPEGRGQGGDPRTPIRAGSKSLSLVVERRGPVRSPIRFGRPRLI